MSETPMTPERMLLSHFTQLDLVTDDEAYVLLVRLEKYLLNV